MAKCEQNCHLDKKKQDLIPQKYSKIVDHMPLECHSLLQDDLKSTVVPIPHQNGTTPHQNGTTPHQNGRVPESGSEDTIRMRNELGLLDGVGIIVGVIVGSGIFVSPTGVIQYTGSVGMSLVVWAVTGILSTIGAICYSELGTMIPKSGGDYAYIYEAFGGLPSFLYLWVALVIIMPTGNTITALTFSNYILQPLFPGCHAPPDAAVRIIAAVIICFLIWINCTNVKAATKIQGLFTITKVFALVVIIVTGGYHMSMGHTENFQRPFEGTKWEVSAISTAFYQGFFSFAGWNFLNFVVEELKDPYKSLSRAIWISLPLVTVIYFLTNVAYFAVLSPAEVVSSSAVAVTFGNRMLGGMAWIIPFFVACSTFGSLNGAIFASSRLFFVGARQGHLPQMLALLNTEKLTPVPSLLFGGFMSLFMLISSDIQILINYISFTESLFVLISISVLLCLRYKEPERNRPIKACIIFPITFFVVCLFLVILPIVERPIELGVAIVVLLSGIPVYWFGCVKTNKPECYNHFMDKMTKSIQILTTSLPDSKVD